MGRDGHPEMDLHTQDHWPMTIGHHYGEQIFGVVGREKEEEWFMPCKES